MTSSDRMPIDYETQRAGPRPMQRVVVWLLLAAIGAAALYAGTMLRFKFFDATIPIHFSSDNNRNWAWGYYTFYNMHDRGRSFLDTYDDVGIQNRRARVWIDYAPLRLAVYTGWAAFNHEEYPYAKRADDRKFWAFFLDVNCALEAIGAAGAFALTRVVLLQAGVGWLRAMILSAIAALLLWFNPAAILSTHGWPSGDMWVVPPFLWALFFARIGRWFWAGVTLAIGILFKGQVWIAVPVLLLWPIFQLRWRPPLLLLAGLLGTFGIATCGWTLTHVDAAHMRSIDFRALAFALLPAVVVIAFAAARPVLVRRLAGRGRNVRAGVTAALALAAVLLIVWPAFTFAYDPPAEGAWLTRARINVLLLFAIAGIAIASAFTMPLRRTAPLAFGLIGACALLGMRFFDTNYAWFDASYGYGTDHWTRMVVGTTSNLPGILQQRYGWNRDTGPAEVVFTLFGSDVTLKTFLFSIFVITLVIACGGIALQDARRSTRFLVAIVAPWVLFFTIPCQIHDRYLLFAACFACCCIGHSVGTALLGVLLGLLTWMMTIHQMLENRQKQVNWSAHLENQFPDWFGPGSTFGTDLHRVLAGTWPDIGWAVILLALIFLFLSLVPGRGRTNVFAQRAPALPATGIADPILLDERPVSPPRPPADAGPIPLVDAFDDTPIEAPHPAPKEPS